MQRSYPSIDMGFFSRNIEKATAGDPMDIIMDKFKSIEDASRIDSKNNSLLAKDIYSYTNRFLESYCNLLSPENKGKILISYMNMWGKCGFIMHINETCYADDYAKSKFSKYYNLYNSRAPMVAGFNMQQANLSGIRFCDSIFPSVNFHGADFSNSMLAYAHFENCDLSAIKTNNDSNLNQCVFKKCKLIDASIITHSLCETRVDECDITNAVFGGNESQPGLLYFRNCVNGVVVNKPYQTLSMNYL